jgi:hypothetical protein
MEPTLPPPEPTQAALPVSSLIYDVRVLLFLFVALRLMLLMAYEPLVIGGNERGLSAGGDRPYHYALMQLTDAGDWPFRDWWSEFPPVWFITGGLVYQGLGNNVSYSNWTIAMSLILLLCEVGNLLLVRSIGSRLHGRATGTALAWIYALLAVPIVQMWWNFESMVAFTLLLSLWWLIQGRINASGIMAGVGALVKFTPVLLLGAVVRYKPVKVTVRWFALAVAVFAAAYGLLLLNNPNPQMTTVSLVAQFGKASYESVWALIDGNLGTGNFADAETDQVLVHYDVEGATRLYGNDAVIPSWLRLAAAGAIGLFVFMRARRTDAYGVVAFAFITMLIFFLQSQGWSPQWLVQILPLTLLCFPTRTGVLTAILLSGLAFAEYPFLFIRTAELGTPGTMSGVLLMPYAAVIILRTLLLGGIAYALYRELRRVV